MKMALPMSPAAKRTMPERQYASTGSKIVNSSLSPLVNSLVETQVQVSRNLVRS